MNHKSCYFSLLLLFCTFGKTDAASRNRTIKAQLNKPVFEFFSKAGHHVVDEEIPKIEIPDITIPIHGGPGKGSVSAYGLKIQKFLSPRFKFELSKNGISWQSSGGVIKLGGYWKAQYTVVVPLSESGWVQVLTSDIRILLSASAYELDGHPQVAIGDCSAEIENLDIGIGGGVLPWIINLFKADISAAIKVAIHKQACDSARTIALEEANEFLHDLPTHIPIGKNFYVDYALLGNPQFTSSYVSVDLSADVVYGNTTCTPTSTGEWTDVGPNPRMVTAWISDSIANCLLSSAHNGNLVQFLATKDIPSIGSYLRTSCSIFSVCIGRFFPKLKTEYPNGYIDLLFHTYSAPVVIFQRDDVRLNVTFAVDFYLNPAAKNNNTLARLLVESSSAIDPYLVGNRLTGALNSTDITVREDFSTIGDMSPAFLTMFQKVFSVTVKMLIDTLLLKGLPLPVLDNITIANSSEIHVFDGYIRLNVDFAYE